MRIDMHAHLRRDPKTKRCLVEQQLDDMDKNGIDKRVISTFYGPTLEEANQSVLHLCETYPDRLIPCAAINPKEDQALAMTQRLLRKGVRIIEMDSLECGFLPEKLEDPINAILEECAKEDVVVKLYAGSTHRAAPDQWIKYFRKFPSLSFMILHMGAGDYQYGTIELCKEYENLLLETSLASEAPALKKALQSIDPSRLFFGSGFPDYFTELELLKFDCYGLTETIKRQIFGDNAKRLLEKERGGTCLL